MAEEDKHPLIYHELIRIFELIEGIKEYELHQVESRLRDFEIFMLKELGYKVLTAKSGKEAIEIYNKNKDKIDMVILDMIMPDMSGSHTFNTLKEINPEIKVLLSSGYSINGQAQEILDRGCNGFIQKPFNLEEFSQKLRAILDEEK